MKILEVENVSHDRKGEILLEKLTFYLQRSEKLVLIGPHGSGKSLLMQLLSGYLLTDSGSIRIHGCDLQIQAQEARKHFGYVPSHSALDPAWTVSEALQLFAEMRALADAHAQAKRMASIWQLEESFDRQVGDIGHGLRMRVLMAAATVHDPALLLLDDPLLSLDPWEVKFLLDTLEQHWSHSAIMMATNRIECIPKCFQRCLILHQGIIAHDVSLNTATSWSEFLDKYKLEQTHEDDMDFISS